MVHIIYVIAFILYSWFLFKSGKKHAERKDEIKLVITGKPEQVKEAIKATFEHRKTGFSDIFAFTDDFITSEIHQRRWHAFTKKKKTLLMFSMNLDLKFHKTNQQTL